ncbi:lipase 3-like [Thrips palmi]|uniref:Lipase 3-like n=1 Tax=Thrips palmi TaxID=161013 RepID=A0A6P8Z3N6_THRPL|nr:lipase 3-like [Thrips palmi]
MIVKLLIKVLLPVARPLVYDVFYAIVGFKKNETYFELPNFLNSIPTGGSWGQIFHYVQNVNPNTQGIRQYDYGAARNQDVYGAPEPPLYNLSAIQTPTHLYLGHNDILCRPQCCRSSNARFSSVHIRVPMLTPMRVSSGVGGVSGTVKLLVAILVVSLKAPAATPWPSGALEVVSGLLRNVGSKVSAAAATTPVKEVSAAVTAPITEASSAIARTTADVVLEQLLRWLPATDDNVTASDLMVDLGYPMQTHFVTTQDGYRLRLERAPNPGRQPVLLAPGLQLTPACFVLLGRGKALAPLLYDAGFDVWMINYRGTINSREHIKLSTKNEEYWDFSWHEQGVFDNAAAIDYVLAQTSFPSVMYAGHSMGATTFMAMAAARPEYQRKVRAAFHMAPAGPMHAQRSPVVELLYVLKNGTQPLVEGLGLRRTMRPLYMIAKLLIKVLLPVARPLVYSVVYSLVGFKKNETYLELPNFLNSVPTGGSWGQIFHYLQDVNPNTQGIRQYDHGAARNQDVYGAPEPPLYNLSAIQTPTHLYLGHNDILCRPQDMAYLRSQLPNVVSVHYDEDATFNHIDFIASRAVGGGMNARIVADMQRLYGQAG